MRSICSLLSLLIALLVSGFADSVDDFARLQMNRNHIPGMGIAVVKDGRILKMTGYGNANLDWNIPVRPDTAFQLASTTKLFTGLALMSLVEEGKIGLDDSVTKYLPNAPATWKPITIRSLATHSSGLKFDLGPGKNFDSIGDAVIAAYSLPLDYETGTRTQYALTDFVVLAKVLENASGKSFTQLIQERIVQPLGLKQTSFDNAEESDGIRSWNPLPHRSTTYRWTGKDQRAYLFLFPKFTYSAGGLFSSLSDLAQLLVAIENGKLLKPKSLETLWDPVQLKDGTTGSFALAWVSNKYRGLRAVGHSGGPALSDVLYFPEEKLGVVVLTNQGTLFPQLASLIADLYLPPSARAADPNITDEFPKTTETLRALIQSLRAGRVDSSVFSAEGKARTLPPLTEFGPMIVNALEPLTRLRLIAKGKVGTQKELVYRAYFGTHPMKWKLLVEADGKIASVEPSVSD